MLKQQLNIFDQPSSGEDLAEAGLALAVEHADKKIDSWSDKCWELFKEWLRSKPRNYEFMVEEFRGFIEENDLLEMPPSLRSFGFISKRGVKDGLIAHAGTAKTKDRSSHSTPVNVWRKI